MANNGELTALLPKQELRTYVEEQLLDWQRRFRMQDWTIHLIISYSKKSDCVASVLKRAKYKEATIRIYPNIIKLVHKRFPRESIDTALAHEFSHLVLYDSMLENEHEVSEEKLVEHLSHIILAQRKH